MNADELDVLLDAIAEGRENASYGLANYIALHTLLGTETALRIAHVAVKESRDGRRVIAAGIVFLVDVLNQGLGGIEFETVLSWFTA